MSDSNKLDFMFTYQQHIENLKQHYNYDAAMQMAVGGDFELFEDIECALLKYYGLKNDDYVVDVGCGSGRLAIPLSQFHKGKYLGIDVMEELVRYAANKVQRSDWRFETTAGYTIPEDEHVADVVCFFSVFTHLLYEESFVYLREAKRILKPHGKIIFSFLDFSIDAHWAVFESNIENVGGVNGVKPLNMFIGHDAIIKWAEKLNLTLKEIRDADDPYIPLNDGKKSVFGQSVAVFFKD